MAEQPKAICWTARGKNGGVGWVDDRDRYARFFESVGAEVTVLENVTKQKILDAHAAVDYDFIGLIGHGAGRSVTVQPSGYWDRKWHPYESLKAWELGAALWKPVKFAILGMCNGMDSPSDWPPQLLKYLQYADWKERGLVMGFNDLDSDDEAWAKLDRWNDGLFDLLNDGLPFVDAYKMMIQSMPYMKDNVRYEGKADLVIGQGDPSTYYLTTANNPSNGGRSSPAGTNPYPPHTNVIVTAIPQPGYKFSHWSLDHAGTENPTTVVMDKDKHVVTNFVAESEPTYTLTTSVSPAGSGSVSPSGGSYAAGSQVILIATPAIGWKFSAWTGDASGSQNPITVPMDSNKTITANFEAQPVPEPDKIPMPTLAQREAFVESLKLPDRLGTWHESLR